ncbi:MAG TPA: hypothetical protein VF132_09235 [Rudaea sp.]
MKKLFGTLVSFAVIFYIGRLFVDFMLAHDMLTNVNACHAELHLAERINQPMDESKIDALYEQWGVCTKRKNNFLDRVFGSDKLVNRTMEAMRDEHKKNGPPGNRRSSG